MRSFQSLSDKFKDFIGGGGGGGGMNPNLFDLKKAKSNYLMLLNSYAVKSKQG